MKQTTEQMNPCLVHLLLNSRGYNLFNLMHTDGINATLSDTPVPSCRWCKPASVGSVCVFPLAQ